VDKTDLLSEATVIEGDLVEYFMDEDDQPEQGKMN
jgi:hypothetical protein